MILFWLCSPTGLKNTVMYTYAFFSVAYMYMYVILFFPCQNLLALGGEDKCITVSNVDGDTIRQVSTHVI